MTHRFDEDDLEDYANEDYDDDNEMTPEDEEKIMQLVPTIRSQLKDYVGFTDADIQDSLWYNYLNVDETLKELRKKFKKIAAQKTEVKPMSKMAALAKARASQRMKQSNDDNETRSSTSVSILDRLKKKPATKTKPLVNLQGLNIPKPRNTTNRSELGTRPPLLNKRTVQPSQEEKSSPYEEVVPTPKDEPIPNNINPSSYITFFDVVFDSKKFKTSSVSRCPATPFFLHPPNTNLRNDYKRKLIDNNLTSVFLPIANEKIVKKIKQNFSKPSPDEIVINAHQQAEVDKSNEERISKEVANLKLAEASRHATKPRQKIDLQAEIAKRQTKPHTSFVIIGHVDAGKSTLTGRLLLERNVVDKNTYIKLKREAERAGKGSFSLAWVMDQTVEERNRGVTVDICSTDFETEKGYFTIVDAPGHKDFVPNMITGVSQADIAVLVIDSSTDAFESGFNLDGQTKEHTILAKSLGINKIIVAVNKMDNNDWSEDRFNEIKSQLHEFLRLTGFQENQIVFIPCSGLTGLNVASKPSKPEDLKKLVWYHGGSILDALEASGIFARDYEKPFVMSIADIENNTQFTGRIDAGTIQPGERVLFAPSNQTGIVDGVIINDAKSSVGIAGDNVTLKIKDINLEQVQVGDIVSIVTNEIPSVKKFESRIVLFDLKRPLLIGTQFILFRGNIQQPAKIVKIVSLLDKVTGEIVKKKPKHLSSKQSAIVEIELVDRPLPLQSFKENRHLGRIVLRKEGQTIGAGIVENF